MKQRARILVVDDTPATRYATTRVLRAHGFEVVEAESGEEALARTDDSIDLVVLDVQLPDIHGFEVCRRLREHDETALIPVIHLSATFRSEADRADGLDAGADGYLTHPIEPIVLVATINTLLRVRRAEDEHRRSEERFREFFLVAPIGTGLLDGNGAFVEANAVMCQILGLTLDEAAGRRLSDFAAAEERAHLEASLAAAPRQELQRIFTLTGASGKVVDVDLRVKQLPRTTLRLALATDITQQRRYEAEREQLLANERAARDEAERVNRLKDQFIAVLGHELRNPLSAIVSGIEVLRHGAVAEEKREWIQEGVARQAARLTGLIDDLLDTTRISYGKLALNKEAVRLADVVQVAVESCAELIKGRSHKLTISMEPPDLKLDADPLRLEQIIVNLLTNAAKYTPEGGSIHLEAKRRDGRLDLVVSDTGVGLAETEIPLIFEAFAQAGAWGQGLGIGLTLVRQLVELHGGSVRAESEGPGKGSAFRVTLPLTPGIAREVAHEDDRGPLSAELRTLVVDDNETAALMLQMLLQAKGYKTEVAFSGKAAIEIAKRFDPELVLLDIGLPDLSGYDVVEQLREAGLTTATIAALSGYDHNPATAPAGYSKFDVHLVKPATLKQIRELAEGIMSRRSS